MEYIKLYTCLKVSMLACVFSSASINIAQSSLNPNATEFWTESKYNNAYLNDTEYQQNITLLNFPGSLPRNKDAIDIINFHILETIKAISTLLNTSLSKAPPFTEARKLLEEYNQNDHLIKSVGLYLYAPLSYFIDELYQKGRKRYKIKKKNRETIEELRYLTDKIWCEIIQIFLLSIIDKNVDYDVLCQMFNINHMQKIIPSEERKLEKIFEPEDIDRTFQPTNGRSEIYTNFSDIINVVDKDLYLIRATPGKVETIQSFAYILNKLTQ